MSSGRAGGPIDRERRATEERTHELPQVVSRDEWVVARKALLAKEKEFTRRRDALNAERRMLPDGRDRQGLRVRRSRREGRPARPVRGPAPAHRRATSCSTRAGTTGARVAPPAPTRSPTVSLEHLHARDTTLAYVSRAPLAKIEEYKAKRGWTFPWYSSFGSDFNYDFHVTLDESVAPVEYNYRTKAEFEAARRGRIYIVAGESSEQPGRSYFLRVDDRRVPHVLGVRARAGVDRRLVLLPRRDRARPPGGLGGAEGPRRPTCAARSPTSRD